MKALGNVTIDQALTDPKLLGAGLGNAASWDVWLSVLRAAFGLSLDDKQDAVFRQVAGGRNVPAKRVRELWAVIGRRSGKSRVAAALATYLAAFIDHGGKLSPGETGTVLVLAASRVQANAVFGYIRGFFESSRILRGLVENVSTDELKLKGNIAIAVHTNSFRTVRGRTLIAAIFDEVAFWRDETAASPDVETYRAVLPALATTDGMLIGISSPYAQRGLLFSKHNAAYGMADPNVLVVQAPTTVFNPTIDTAVIEQAHADDPEAAAAEWEAEFRGDLSMFIDRRRVEACVDVGVHERPFNRAFRYTAFCDPSGGVHDSMTLGVAHREGDAAVLDVIREVKPPFVPADVVNEFARLLKTYGVASVTGDRYGGQWVSDAFHKSGIRYVPSERSRSEIYLDALPGLMAGTSNLLDHVRLVGQISQLERRTTRNGRDTIDHMRGANDDVANAALGALVCLPTRAANTDNWHSSSRAPVVRLGHTGMKKRMLKGRNPPNEGR